MCYEIFTPRMERKEQKYDAISEILERKIGL
jgi:hypothetical protein